MEANLISVKCKLSEYFSPSSLASYRSCMVLFTLKTSSDTFHLIWFSFPSPLLQYFSDKVENRCVISTKYGNHNTELYTKIQERRKTDGFGAFSFMLKGLPLPSYAMSCSGFLIEIYLGARNNLVHKAWEKTCNFT